MAKRRYEKPHVPDGGRGWFVCFGSFLIQALTNGTVWSFGIIFIDLLGHFGTRQAATAWIGSIQATLFNITGILAIPLMHKFGWRGITVMGGAISALGFGTSALAPNIYVLYFTYGVLTGVGNGMMFITSIVIVQQYFSKYRAVANGIALSGSGVGIFAFGFLTQYLVTDLGWKWTAVIYAGITLTISVCCAIVFSPLTTVYESFSIIEGVNSQDLSNIEESESDALCDNHHEPNEQKRMNYGSVSETSSEYSPQPLTVRRSSAILCTVPSLIEDSGIFDFEFMEYPCSSQSITTPPTTPPTSPSKQQQQHLLQQQMQTNGKYPVLSVLKNMFDFSMFKNPVFNLFTFTVLTCSYGNIVLYTYLPEWGMAIGMTYGEASLLICVVGVCSLSRLLYGWVSDKIPKRRFDLLGVIITVQGILALASAAFLHYSVLVVYSAIMGMTIGGISTMYPVILVDLLGREHFDKALNLIIAVKSLAFIIAAPLSGFMIDQRGNPHDVTIPFMVAGGLFSIGGLTYFLILCIQQPSYVINDSRGLIKSQLHPGRRPIVEEARPFSMRKSPFNEPLVHPRNHLGIGDDTFGNSVSTVGTAVTERFGLSHGPLMASDEPHRRQMQNNERYGLLW